MQIILLERVENLGQMGDVVAVRPGFARNFLLPKGKALRATKENVSYFDAQKKVLEADSLKKKAEAEKVAKKMDGVKVAIIRAASEVGHLYGSVSASDIASQITEAGFKVSKSQVRLDRAYKNLGLFPVRVTLHPEVVVEVTLNIARTAEEAKIQEEKGEALVAKDEEVRKAPVQAPAPAAAAPAPEAAPADEEEAA